ncbi:MAG TPA: transglycosylase SLT domain-containing protein [Stenotrophobium sp.]|nr:transglycosylase SLT domain-containing protein [Stenotrophobium sp.]
MLENPVKRWVLLLGVAGLALLAGGSCAAADGPDMAAVRTQFRDALTRAAAGETAQADPESLRTYVLYPYLLAARQQRQLQAAPGNATDASVQAFLLQYPALPVARDLRQAWLHSLAQREAWPEFLKAYSADASDADLRCIQLLARIKTGPDANLRDDALKIWMTGQTLPPTCIPAFDWIAQQGWLTPELREQRAQLAVDAGNAELTEFLAQSLPAAIATPLMRLAALQRAPRDELNRLLKHPHEAVQPKALLAAFTRVARSDPDAALKLYRPLLRSRHLQGDDAVPFTAALAVGLSLSRRPEALRYFRQVPDRLADDSVFEWRARAALWDGQWRLARSWIAHMPKSLRTQDRWIYWYARALDKHKAGRAQAKKLFTALSQGNGLFAPLAAWRLRQDYQPHPELVAADDSVWTTLQANGAIIRARELHRVDQDDWAAAEWRQALSGQPRELRLQAGLMAASWNWPTQAIATLAGAASFNDFDVTYPLPFNEPVNTAAALTGLSPAWIYAVLRQESLYNPEARSRSNALGLLQLLLPTARAVAARWKQPIPTAEDLFKPEVNIPLGAAYLSELRKRFEGRYILALGAYNAGPGAVARWLPDKPQEADIWIENIPYNETRGYIQRILWHVSVFAWRETGKPQSLADLMQPVAGP